MALSQAEIDELDALLGEFARLEEADGDQDISAPLVSELDGFLTALVVSTERIPQDEWLAVLLPGAERILPAESFDRLTARVLARKAVIAGALMRGEASFEPIFEIDGRHDEVLWEIWIDGFDRAMQLRMPTWLALREHPDEAVVDAFTTIAVLVLLARGESPKPDDEDAMREEAPDLVPLLAEVLYCHLRGLPTVLDEPEPQQPIRVAKIGRNEPCPCGSGKKYKKCCMAG